MMSPKGFTLIEIIIVLAIFIAIIGFGMTIDWHAFQRDTFSSEEATIVALLSKARSLAMANVSESGYGLCYKEPDYIIFRKIDGVCQNSKPANEASPANKNIASNTSTAFPVIIFDRLTGNTAGGTIHLTDGVKSADIVINNEGTINW